jgi:hypothetical protein
MYVCMYLLVFASHRVFAVGKHSNNWMELNYYYDYYYHPRTLFCYIILFTVQNTNIKIYVGLQSK